MAAELISRVSEDDRLQEEVDTHKIVARVAMGLIFDNPLSVKPFLTRHEQLVEALALIGMPTKQSFASVGESIKLGYHYAYLIEDLADEEMRAGLVIANPLIRQHGKHPENRETTLRQYVTSLDRAPVLNEFNGVKIPDRKVFRTDFQRSVALGTVPLEDKLRTPLNEKTLDDDPVTQAFKDDIATILSATPLRPRSNYIHKKIDL